MVTHRTHFSSVDWTKKTKVIIDNNQAENAREGNKETVSVRTLSKGDH